MADGNADWALWQNPVSAITGGVKDINSLQQTMRAQRAQQAYAANPSDPDAIRNFMLYNPDAFTKTTDAQTSLAKSNKALTDAQTDAATSAATRAYIAAHPEAFGGQANPPAANDDSMGGAAATSPTSPTPSAPNPTPSPASVNVHTPARAPASALGSLGSPALPTSTSAASALGSLTAPASEPTSNLSSVLGALNDPSMPAIAQPAGQPAGSTAISLLGTLGQAQPADPSARAASMLQAGNLSSVYGLNPNPTVPGGLAAAADPNAPVPQGSTTGAAPAPASAPAAPSDGNGDIVVTARRRQQPQAPVTSLADIAMLNPDAASKLAVLQTHVASLGESARKALADKTETWAALGAQLSTIPYAQRSALIDSYRSVLKAHGVSDQEIDSFDPTDANIATEQNLAIGYKGVLDQRDKDRSFAETVHDHNVTHALTAQGQQITVRGQNMSHADRMAELNGSSGGALSPGTLDYAAQIYRTTGQIPAVGSGNRGSSVRTMILQRAAEQAAAEGQTGADDAGRHADYSANVGALRQLQKTRTAVEGFENTAGRNMDQVLRLAPANAVNGAPIFNRWVQSGRRSIAGDAGVAQFDVAVNTAANEYAKVVNTVSGGGVSTDSARHEAMTLLHTAQTPAQLNSAIGQMKIDMANRRAGFVDQQIRLQHNITGAPPAAAPVSVSSPIQARALPPGTRFVTPDGRVKIR